jgi:hypothetical protein
MLLPVEVIVGRPTKAPPGRIVRAHLREEACGWLTLLVLLAPLSATRAQGVADSIVAWGVNSDGQCNVPPPNVGFTAVGAGYRHSVGLKADGSIVAWGYNNLGQCDVPAPNQDFTAVAVGDFHNLGLKSDGSIVGWGWNADGQCDVPAPNTGFAAVAASEFHSLGLKSDGSVVAWGYNFYGECDVPAPNEGFTAVAAGTSHSLGLKSDGSIVAWGSNDYGERVVPQPNTGFIAIGAGWCYSMGLKSDGSIVAWGNNDFDQCEVPTPNTGFVALGSARYASFALKPNGSLVAWGDISLGLGNVPAPNMRYAKVAGGTGHAVALRSVRPTWLVPAEAPTIQAGIDFARSGDTVLVACGTYHEHALALKSGVTVRSASGEADCVTVDGDFLDGVVTAQDLAGGRLEGLTITHGHHYRGGGIALVNSPVEIANCVLHGNTATSQGGGIHLDASAATLRNVTVANNMSPEGGALYVSDAALTIENSILAFNDGVAIHCSGSADPQLACTDIYGNTLGDWVGSISAQLVMSGNLCANPVFCTALPQPYRLDAASPCLPANNACGELMGALGQGCAVVAVEGEARTRLGPNVPNPFSRATTIQFGLRAAGRVRLAVFGLDGRRVATLLDAELPAGEHAVEWRGADDHGRAAPSGVYFCRLEADGRTLVRRASLVR